MGLYWRRSTKILPGVRINWSKNGPSISMGPKGAKVNIGKRGTYVSGGIPGTGLYYRQKVGGGSKSNSSSTTGTNPPTNATTQTTFGFSKQGCLVFIVASVILSLLLSSNFITAALLAVIAGLYWFFFMSRKKASTPQPNTNATRPTQPVPISPPSTPTPFQSAPSSNDIDVKVTVAEVEHLITEIDNTTDKVKLPSIYRKLMSIIYKLEKINGVEIKGLPIDIPKNYYPDDNPDNRPLLTWRAQANNLYTNWLNYYVYQVTPYDLDGTPDLEAFTQFQKASLEEDKEYVKN